MAKKKKEENDKDRIKSIPLFKKLSTKKVEKLSETKPKKIATPKEKPKKEVKPKPKPKPKEKTTDEDELIRQFEEETGKKAIWRGKETKGYLDWKNEKLG